MNGPKPDIPEAMMFDAGADAWRNFSGWPPGATRSKKRFLEPGAKLGFVRSSARRGAFDEYVKDPNRPVPPSAFNGPGMPRHYLIEDQRFALQRPDVLHTFHAGQ